jgi:hypothetical protein
MLMKGYSEDRGLASRLDYDAESKQFVAKPVAHAFQPKPAPDAVEQKPALHEKRSVIKKARSPVSKWQPKVSAA